MEEPQDPKVRIRQERERLKVTRGKLIRRARELLGLSQEELALKINGAGITVSRWEREVGQGPNLYHQRHLAAQFGLEVEELGYLQAGDDQANQILWNVPFRRNPYFTGYDEVIEDLHLRLSAEKDGVAIETISGLGGIGKTQLMLEYAYRKRDDFQAVFWLRADTQELLEEDLAQTAKLLEVPEARKRQPNHQYLVTEARQWFRKHSGWLLLLDNVEENVEAKSLLLEMSHGHVLLTTRSQAVAELASNIHLDKMMPEVGTLLLLRRTLPPLQLDSVDAFSEAHRLEAMEISLLLDGLPLALDQAGAYIRETGCSLTEYIQLYHKHRKELLTRRSEREKLYSDYRESVATTWLISFGRIEQQCPAATKLLDLCAFLHADAIPEEILLAGTFLENTEMRPIVDDALQFNQAHEVLLRYSLIRRNAGANLFSIHRLVQAVLQDRMDDQTQHLWAERAVHAVEKAFVSDHSERVEYYIAQATLCADLIQQWELAGDEVTRLLERVAREVYKRGCYSQALTLFESAQKASSVSQGSDDPRTLKLLSELGRVYMDIGNYRMAMNLWARTGQDFERVLGPGHPAVVDCLNNLALAATRGKNLATAIQFNGQACDWHARLLEPKYAAEKATTYYITAEIAAQLGPEGILYAEDYYLDALDIAIEVWGRGSAKFSDILGGLGRLYTRYRKFEQAEQLLRQALEIRRSVFGHGHPQVADSLGDLAELAQCQGDLAAAEQFYKQALAIRLEKLGLYHPEVAQTFRALAGLAWHQGKGNEAKQMFTYAFIYYGSLNDLKSPDYLSLLSEWAAFSRNRGWVKEADACEQEVASTTKLREVRRAYLSKLIIKEKPDPIACFLQSLSFRRKRVIDDSTRRL